MTRPEASVRPTIDVPPTRATPVAPERQQWPTISLADRTLLLAVNGAPESTAAARLALALARRRGARPEVVSAFNPAAYTAPGDVPAVLLLSADLLSDEALETRRRELRHTLGVRLGETPDWPAHVRVGAPAGAIVREAERTGAAMILVGLRRHGIVDRVLRDETALQVARAARVPVLAVAPSLTELPTRVVVGVDFSRASIRAARAALSVIGDGGTLLLAYARPDAGDRDDEATEGQGLIERQGVQGAFQALRRELAAPAGVKIEPVILIGEPAAELRSFAERAGAQLIAVGSHRHETLERWLIGSVTTDLLRDGGVSTLVVPPWAPRGAVAGGLSE